VSRVQVANLLVERFVNAMVLFIGRIGFFTAEKDAAAQRAILSGQTSRTLLVWAPVARRTRRIDRFGPPEHGKFAESHIQAMVKQIESAAGPSAHTEIFIFIFFPAGCPIEGFINVEYCLQECVVAPALHDRSRQVASVGGLAIILGWHCVGSRSLRSYAASPG